MNNIRSKSLGADTVEIQYNANNQISRARDTRDGNIWRTYVHDARGNVTSNNRIGFSYDRSDQPVTMWGIASGSYAYDAHNRRVKQTINGETIYSVYGLDGTLRYRDNVTTGDFTDYFRLGQSGPTLLRVLNGGASYNAQFRFQDHLGSAAVSTTAGSSGALLWREHYTPFGETLNNPAGNADNPGFTGHIRDTATGLTYAQALYYDPAIGRFLSNDPVGFADKGPLYFNRYAYLYNDPINAADPTGKCGPAMGVCIGLGLRAIAAGGRAAAGAYRAWRANRSAATTAAALEALHADTPTDELGNENDDGSSRPTGDDIGIGDKIREQMGPRGWTEGEIRELTETEPSGTSEDNQGGRNDPASVYGERDGGHVVINDETGEVVQISDKNDPNWIPDDRIEWHDDS